MAPVKNGGLTRVLRQSTINFSLVLLCHHCRHQAGQGLGWGFHRRRRRHRWEPVQALPAVGRLPGQGALWAQQSVQREPGVPS